MWVRASAVVTVTLGLVFGVVVAMQAAAAPGYQHRQEYFTAPDGTRLHADVLRPVGVADDVRTPVVMTVSPYRAHLAYLSQPRLGGGVSTENLQVDMFLEAGYTYVIVDLRGFGGSNGCPDFGGPKERSDVRTAVEWAASQPWSTGRVGLNGISYEAWTGIMGLATEPAGLAAVAAFEPVVDPNSYLYMQGIAWKFSGKPVTESGVRPGNFAGFEHLLIAQTPGHWTDSDEYRANASSVDEACYRQYLANIGNHDASTEFWRDRDLVERVRGTTIPTFLGQGFVDYNTRADRVIELWNALGPGDHKAWFGQWGHRNCHEKCGTPFFDTELLAFFDKHVAQRDVTVPGPRITVGQFDGKWRGENRWPPADSRPVAMHLRDGVYTDRGFVPGTDRDVWTISQPLEQDQHFSGVSTATLNLEGAPGTTVTVELYDIAPDGQATVITRGIAPVTATANVRLLAQDWPIPAGHRIGVRVTDVIDDVWAHSPTFTRVTVTGGEVRLPLLDIVRNPDIPGGLTEGIPKWRAEKTIPLPTDLVNNAMVTVSFPPRTAG